MQIENCILADIDEILRLYDAAVNLQKQKGAVLWQKFERDFIATEISSGHQWKMVEENQITCVWTTAFEDPMIWEERNADAAVYLHRIATNPAFRGQNLVKEIVCWADHFAAENHKKFIRMDTVGENTGLINYYQKCGFNFLGLFKLKNAEVLPAHYRKDKVCLFERKIKL